MRNNYDNPGHQNSLVTRRDLVSGIAAAAAVSALAPEFAFAADTKPEQDKPMPPRTSSFKLSNGVLIPDVGFGTWQIPDGDKAYDSVAFALANGYRHIDTARAYGNEASVGRAIRDSKLPRDQVFVTSKCPAEIKDAAGARATFNATMAALQFDKLDLYLIHAPWPWNQRGADYSKGNVEVWKVFEELYAAGRARSIGVSNFEVKDLHVVMDKAKVLPMVNQIRYFIGNTEPEVTAFSKAQHMLVEAYSPLATGAVLKNPDLQRVADHYQVSVAQLCIRYPLQKGVLPLPKSTTPKYIRENIDLDFVINANDMAYLDGLKIDA